MPAPEPAMKALTICQPYPERILSGEKPLENRTWHTAYRGRFYIHAGKSRAWLDNGDVALFPDMTFGAIVGEADAVACWAVDDLPADLQFNEHANGPYCIVIANPERYARPVPCRGALGWWAPNAETVKAIAALKAEAKR